jgi:hypothetical protein
MDDPLGVQLAGALFALGLLLMAFGAIWRALLWLTGERSRPSVRAMRGRWTSEPYTYTHILFAKLMTVGLAIIAGALVLGLGSATIAWIT